MPQFLPSPERIEPVQIDDPRLAPYVNIRHVQTRRDGDFFIAEGRLVVERLIDSDYSIKSIVVEHGLNAAWIDRVATDVSILSLPRSNLEQLLGFNFHRGVIACGIRRRFALANELDWNSVPLALAAIGVTEPENMGSILRTAAALGVQHILIGPSTTDPFSRRVLRVSMATALKHNFYDLYDPLGTIRSWSDTGVVRSVATTLDPSAVEINNFRHDHRPLLLMMGNEAHGLSKDLLRVSTDRVTIPMQLGTDSLNVSVAAALFLYELTRLKTQ